MTNRYGSKSGYESYVKETAERAVLETLVCYADRYNESYGTNATTSQKEKDFNKNLLRLVFIEEDLSALLMQRIDGLPVIGE